jgi:hypothetical protein
VNGLALDQAGQRLRVLARWLENGYRTSGRAPEICLGCHADRADQGVTEPQAAVVRD